MAATHLRLAFAILAIVFFSTPIAAAGDRRHRASRSRTARFATPPRLSQGWEAFDQTTQFLVDRMPLREQAVQANTWIWTDLLDTTPRYGGPTTPGQEGPLPAGDRGEQEDAADPAVDTAAQVLAGRAGWLFVHAEMHTACGPPIPVPKAIARWRKLLDAIRAEGRPALLAVAPDKGSVYPEHLDDFPGSDCVTDGKRRFWTELERAESPSGVISLRDDLLRLKRRAGDDLYARKDSHWTTAGTLALVRAVLDGIGHPGVALRDGEIVDPGRGEYTGDLTNLLGVGETDTQAQRGIERDPAAKRIPGRTLLIGDSYAQGPTAQLAPYFDDLKVVFWAGTTPAELAREVRAADRVVVETVEREFTHRAVELVPQVTRQLQR